MIKGQLTNKNDMVTYEACRAICSIKDVTPLQLAAALNCLKLMLYSTKPVIIFAAVRTLNKLAMTNPQAVAICNIHLEPLISHANRSIATFAITTLLKTGTEQSVDRLMKQISGFVNEISEDFKVIVVDAIRSLCLKFPTKHILMLTFLSQILRDEGGYEFKKNIVNAFFDIVHSIPASIDFALTQLCEFIEDCEHPRLSVRILHLLGELGPNTTNPSQYIRHIYNRLILEVDIIRAAAVSSLAQFAVRHAETRASVRVLLERYSYV